MRLHLSSFRLGTDPQHLVVRREEVAAEVAALAVLGVRPTELDLRDHAGATSVQIAQALSAFDALWVRGGNVFVLRSMMAASAADEAVVGLLADDRLMYASPTARPWSSTATPRRSWGARRPWRSSSPPTRGSAGPH
jgi:dipeptidase E